MSTSPFAIEMRANRAGQMRAYLVGTRIRVQDIVSDHERHGLSPEEIAREYPQLSLAQIFAALAFYHEHRDEMREQMKADDEFVRQMESAQQSAHRKSTGDGTHDDSVSS